MAIRDPAKWYPHDHVMEATLLKLIPRWVLPNHITIFRFLMTPFVVWLIAAGRLEPGIIAFLLVAFTDVIDGSMARTRNQITKWGTLFDPVADKLLIGAVLVVIVFEYVNPLLGITIIVLEFFMLLGGYIRLRRGVVTPANLWGKIKMFLQVAGVTFLLIAVMAGIDLFIPISFAVFSLAIVFALLSLVTHGI